MRSAEGIIKEVEYLGPSTRFLVALDAGVTLMALRQNTSETSVEVEALRNSRTTLSWDQSSEYQVHG
jgi:putative spermidine/putrescine transport system ATP-binding protein